MKPLMIVPISSEKAYSLSTEGVYTFNVPLTANKQQIAKNVEAQYGVSVISVTTAIKKGKTIAFSRGKRNRPGSTRKKDTKKAYVTLKEGDAINVFEDATKEKEGDK